MLSPGNMSHALNSVINIISSLTSERRCKSVYSYKPTMDIEWLLAKQCSKYYIYLVHVCRAKLRLAILKSCCQTLAQTCPHLITSWYVLTREVVSFKSDVVAVH